MGYLRIVEETTKKRMTPLRTPTSEEALVGLQEDAMKNLVNLVQNEDIGKYRELAAKLLENNEALDLVAAALKSITKEPESTPVSLSEERPLPMRRDRNGGGGGRGGNDRGRSSRGGSDRRSGGGGDRRREGGNSAGGSRRDSGRREGSNGNSGGARREGSSPNRDRRPRQRRED